jgi:hypothetical protein
MKKIIFTTIAIFGLASITMAQVPNYLPTNGLVGWWPFNGNANDQSGNGNNGSVNGASLTFDRFGQTSTAYSFDGINNFIQVNNAAIFNLVNGHSISVWYKPNSIHQAVIIEKFNPTNGLGDGGPQLVLRSNQLVDFSIFHNNTGNFVYSNIPSTNQLWHHIVATWNGNLIRLYQNGLLTDSIPLSVTLNQCNEPMMIGKRSFQNDLHFDGVIDDIGMWNRALTQLEISALYNGCSASVTIQPISQSVNISNNAQFTTASSDPLATYQWQTDLGVGYQNLNSVGQYSGTANDTLTIANTTLSNNNQPFRCIVSSGSCSDTSNVAILTVNNNVGINEFTQDNLFSVYPNPAKSQINVKADAKLLGSIYTVYDNTGKLVLSGKIISENTTIELGNLSGGIYLFRVGENLKQTFKVIKE